MSSTQLRPTRRTLVRGAAWSVPVVSIAAAAPAFASSRCLDGTYAIAWEGDYNNSTKVATAVLTGTSGTGTNGGTALTLTVSSEVSGSIVGTSGAGYTNLRKTTTAMGGTASRALALIQGSTSSTLSTPRSNNAQTVTLKFSRPVWDLKFTLSDIDSNDGQYQDRVFVSGNPAFVPSAQVQGSGTADDLWRPRNTDMDQDPESSSLGSVAVDYAGKPPSDTYTITYWNNQSGTLSSNGLQGVFLQKLTFGAETCA